MKRMQRSTLGFAVLIVILGLQVNAAKDGELMAINSPDQETGHRCDARTSILIHHRDLLFDHPDTALSVSVHPACPCHVTDILVSCGSDWDQSFVAPHHLTVVGDGHHCLLLPGQVVRHVTPTSFLYQRSPAILDLLPISATFVDCNATQLAASSEA